MDRTDEFAAAAAALPQDARRERERPFWAALAAAWRWRRVADAGCGAGFHVRLLRDLGVATFGFDLSAAALPSGLPGLAAGDLLAPPLRPGGFDAALCLGNTLSLLPDRAAQRAALAALGALVRAGGVVLVQAEDAGAVIGTGAPLVRARRLEDGRVHLRVLERRGRRVSMLAGVVEPGGAARLARTWLLPTDRDRAAALSSAARLTPVPLPAPAPLGASWWLALERR